MQRREFVLSAGAAAAVGLTGCINGNGDDGDNETENGDNGNGDGPDYNLVDEEPSYDGYFEGVESYESVGGTVDWTGEEQVTVEAGSDEFTNQFNPPAIQVDAGTTVEWDWVTSGHDVTRATEASGTTANERADGVDTGGDWEGEGEIASPPHTYTHTFEEAGIHLFVCTPHDAQRMYGAVVVTESDGAEDSDTDGEENGNETSTDGTDGEMNGNETSTDDSEGEESGNETADGE